MLDKPTPNIIDLFCGCSGFGLGATQAGFDVTLSVDIDATLTSSHAMNFPTGKLLLQNIAEINGADLMRTTGRHVDGIIGGPPCQGFSSIGRRDPSDPRRELVYQYFRLISEIRPKFFVMENVKGILFEKNRALLDEALALVDAHYTVCGPFVLDAADYGAATSRPRVFVVGYDSSDVDSLTADEIKLPATHKATVRDALHDLQSATPTDDENGFDFWQYSAPAVNSRYQSRLRSLTGRFSGHRKTPHRADIAARFASVEPGKIDSVGRHPRLSWDGTCPTLRAGTGADKGSYQAVRPLHPEEPRVITVREAARLQGFPDDFLFHPTVWHSFRMIGNSVSPFMSHHLLSLIWSRLAVNQRQALNVGWVNT
jgi:DNA (cytosine-5)-methyltransferase 1